MSEKMFDQAYDLTGQVAVVTGAMGGIGLPVVTMLAERGAKVVLLDVAEEVISTANYLPGKGHSGRVINLLELESIGAAVADIEGQYGKIDILINNAGTALIDDAISVTEAAWDLQMALNLKAPFLLAQAVGRGMLHREYGRIVNVASQAGVVALQGHVAYTSSKAALIGMTKALALEWGPKGVTVNAVSPTVVNTALGRRVFEGKRGEDFRAQLPTRRFAEPEEIALTILYLVSKGSGSTNGANVMVDGGYTIQ
ncbi:NAD-dependent glycerol dehydrogenase [Pseudomonas fluorescens]|nr:NAD-dependent glycerol dehydrogenase [Pseudomonas fluorescens]